MKKYKNFFFLPQFLRYDTRLHFFIWKQKKFNTIIINDEVHFQLNFWKMKIQDPLNKNKLDSIFFETEQGRSTTIDGNCYTNNRFNSENTSDHFSDCYFYNAFIRTYIHSYRHKTRKQSSVKPAHCPSMSYSANPQTNYLFAVCEQETATSFRAFIEWALSAACTNGWVWIFECGIAE